MQTTLKMICTVGGTAALVGCASSPAMLEPIIVPATAVRHSQESADAYYTLGRYHHGGRRLDEAAKAYQHALDIDAKHVLARNALGILRAERGDFGAAIPLLRAAAEADPNNGQFFNNLGYAYYLSGDYVNAAAMLEVAVALEPKNVRAWNNLGGAMEKLGKVDRARQISGQVKSLRTEGKQDGHGEKTPAIGKPNPGWNSQAASAPAERTSVATVDLTESNRTDTEYRTEITQVTPGLFEVRKVTNQPTESVGLLTAAPASSPAAAPAPVATSDARSAQSHGVGLKPSVSRYELAAIPVRSSAGPLRIEISNGNGINGMAKALGKIIGGPAMKVVRLTNQPQFNVKTTRIEYSEGYEQAARTLARNLGLGVDVRYSSVGRGSNVRIVLGRDLTDTQIIETQFSGKFRLTQNGSDKRG